MCGKFLIRTESACVIPIRTVRTRTWGLCTLCTLHPLLCTQLSFLLMLSYGDDFQILAASKSYRENNKRLNDATTRMCEKATNLGMSFAPEKVELLHIQKTKGPKVCTSGLKLTAMGITVQPANAIKVLGFMIDKNRSGKQHWIQQHNKMQNTLAVIRRLATTGKGIRMKALHVLANALIRCHIEYGAPVFAYR